MGGMGPVSDGHQRRRNAVVPMTQLPAEGWRGAIPPWPLPPDLRMEKVLRQMGRRIDLLSMDAQGEGPRAEAAQAELLETQVQAEALRAELQQVYDLERELWHDLWRLPQAALWVRQRFTREVAQYVRWKIRAELGELPAAKEARQLSDRLLLTPLALLRARCEVTTDQVAEQRAAAAAAGGTGRAEAKRRQLRVADPDPGTPDSGGPGAEGGDRDAGAG